MIVTNENYNQRRLLTEQNHGRLKDRALGHFGSSSFHDPNMSANTPERGRRPLLKGGMNFNLRGLGDYAVDASGNVLIDPATGLPVQSNDTNTIADMITKGLALLNSQQVFQLNLSRAQAGLQPISVPTPMMNLGIGGISAPLLLLGGGLLIFALMKR